MGLGKILLRNAGRSVSERWNELEGKKKRDFVGGVVTAGSLVTGLGSPFVPIAGAVYFGVRYRNNLVGLYERARNKVEDMWGNYRERNLDN